MSSAEPCADGQVEAEAEHVVVEGELESAAETLPVGGVRLFVGDFVAGEDASVRIRDGRQLDPELLRRARGGV